MMRRGWIAMLGTAMLVLTTAPAAAQLMVSANDGKQLTAGEAPSARTRDEVTILRVDRGAAPRILASVAVPASMIGPPRSIAITRDRRYALVTASQRLNDASPPALVPGDSVSVIDLRRPSRPRVLQTVQAGAGASGIALNRAGTLALVANAVENSVSVFRFRRGRLTELYKLAFEPGSKPVAADFAPDGRSAWVVAQLAGRVHRLKVAGEQVDRTSDYLEPGIGPYSLATSRDGRFGYVTNLGGNGPAPAGPQPPAGLRVGSIAVLDLRAPAVIQRVEAGVVPEHVALSPDGRFLALVLINGSNPVPGAPGYHDYGLLRVFAVREGRLTPLAESHTGAWCQGAAWSADGARLLLQCAAARVIEVYGFDGSTLTPHPDERIQLESRPGAIAGP